MSNLSDFLALGGSGAVKTAYYTTSGTKTLVPNDGVDKLVYLAKSTGIGTTGNRIDNIGIFKQVSDLNIDAKIGNGVDLTNFGGFTTADVANAVCFYDEKIIVSVDTGSPEIAIYDRNDLSLINSFPAADSNATTGLTVINGNLFSVGTDDIIRKHSGLTSTILTSFLSPGSQPYGLANDGTNLISADQATDLIYVHSGETSTISSSFPTPSGNPRGLDYDGYNLVVGNTGPLVFFMDRLSSTVISSFVPEGVSSNLSGVCYFDKNTIIVTDSDSLANPKVGFFTRKPLPNYAAIQYLTQEV